MEKRNPQIAILNLTGELAPELSHYFTSRNIIVVNPLEDSAVYDWSHILTRDIQDFTLINKTYEVTLRERNIISLSKVIDLQNFTLNNGNLVLDDCWFKGPMGQFILDKYLQSYGALSLGDNYPSFSEIGSFNITNPFNTGEYLDRMVQKAFENGTEALTVKTYFDHLVMYVTGLKNKEKAGLPFEVTYGVFEDIFAVQINFYSKQLNVMDVSTSLSSSISKRAEEYYLNVAVQSADFFDLSFLPQVNKVVITALWTKDERIKFENRGLMLASLIGGVPLALYQNEGSSSGLTFSRDQIADHSEKIKIPDTLTDEVTETLVSGFTEEGVKPIVVRGGEKQQKEESFIVPEAEEHTEDEKRIIRGETILEEIAHTVKGKFDEEKDIVKISGDKIDVEKVAFSIASKIDESTKEKNLQVRSLGQYLPQSIKTGLFDFAKGLNKDVENLSDNDLDLFQIQKVPDILRNELLKVTSRQLQNNKEEADSALKQAEAKLSAAAVENEKLKNQLKTLAAEVRILKESRHMMAEVQMKAKMASAEVTIKSDDDDELRKEFQQKLNDQKILNEMELKKLSSLLDRESKLIAELRQEEMKSRKLQLEATQKDAYFHQEIEKAQRQVKGKDLILIKTKETFTKLIEKKDQQVAEMKVRVDLMSKAAAVSQNNSQAQTIRDLEKQNQTLSKQVEVYKSKISTLSTNMLSSKSDDAFKDEARKLQMMNQQLKNQLDMSKKEVEKLQSRISHESAQLSQFKLEKSKLEEQLKKAQAEAKTNSGSGSLNAPTDAELRKIQAHSQILETQVRDSASKITNLEARLAEALKPQKAVAGDEGSKVKLSQLENSVKKLTQDLLDSKTQLADAKKETNKLRQEKTALQNQLDKLKKEADKAKSAAPKKTNGKAA